jgi:hypothetical protein
MARSSSRRLTIPGQCGAAKKAGLTAHLTAIKAYNARRRESAGFVAEMLMRWKEIPVAEFALELWVPRAADEANRICR